MFDITRKGKEEGKDQESIQSSTTPNPGYQGLSGVSYMNQLKIFLYLSQLVKMALYKGGKLHR